jgi:hypothetical protein
VISPIHPTNILNHEAGENERGTIKKEMNMTHGVWEEI